jgi:hypothetical protein
MALLAAAASQLQLLLPGGLQLSCLACVADGAEAALAGGAARRAAAASSGAPTFTVTVVVAADSNVGSGVLSGAFSLASLAVLGSAADVSVARLGACEREKKREKGARG